MSTKIIVATATCIVLGVILIFFIINPSGYNPVADDLIVPTASTTTQGCYVGGCSGQICSESSDIMSTCEYRPIYACYKNATCGVQATGECGWTQTEELTMCIRNAGTIEAEAGVGPV